MDAFNGSTRLEWDEIGPSDGTPLLLIMGLGAQMIAWRPDFCGLLAEQGYRVIRFDNRDVGLSSITPGEPPSKASTLKGALGVGAADAAYTLSDMAADAMAVLDAAAVDEAHVVGASLGGMIAQTAAIEHPTRVRSLTSIMSRPGSLRNGLPTPRVLKQLITPLPDDPDASRAAELERFGVIAGSLYDREAMAAFLEEAYARSTYRAGMGFQLAAMFASGDRTPALRSLDVPTLVIHGAMDPLVQPSGGRATARAVAGSQLLELGRMGHDLPMQLWPTITDAIGSHARRAERQLEARHLEADLAAG